MRGNGGPARPATRPTPLPFAALAALTVACTHDFSIFEPTGAGASDGAPGPWSSPEAGAGVDTGAPPADGAPFPGFDAAALGEGGACGSDCKIEALSCAGTCAEDEQSCAAQCTGTDGGCTPASCVATQSGCTSVCVTSCETCTSGEGCVDPAGCAAAAP